MWILLGKMPEGSKYSYCHQAWDGPFQKEGPPSLILSLDGPELKGEQ